MSAWDFTGSEADPEHRFHRRIRDMEPGTWIGPLSMPDPQEDPGFVGCQRCGVEDCPGADAFGVCDLLVERGFEPDESAERVDMERERWNA